MKYTLAGLLGFLLVGIIAAQTCTHGQVPNGGGRLAGTWDAAVIRTDCSTGAELQRLQSTGSFNQGGTFAGITSATPPPFAADRSPELGVWKHIGENHYQVRFKAYLFAVGGVAIGYQIVTHDIELDADNLNYTSEGTATFYNMNGVQTGSGCSAAVAKRMLFD